MKIAELVTAVIIALFSVYLMWKSGQGPSWDPDVARFDNIGINIDGEGPGSGFWPFWLSLIMLVCAIWTIFNAWRGRTPPSQSDEPFMDAYGKRMLLFVGGGLVCFLLLVGGLGTFGVFGEVKCRGDDAPFLPCLLKNGIGFYGGIFVFLMYYLLFLGRHSFKLSLAISIAAPVFFFFFFDIGMKTFLPKGALEPLFVPLYAIFL